jgi:hypothetical protein
MKDLWKIAILFVCIAVIAISLGHLVILSFQGAGQQISEYRQGIFDEGKRAKQNGVPATANPYIGRSYAEDWLNGWQVE